VTTALRLALGSQVWNWDDRRQERGGQGKRSDPGIGKEVGWMENESVFYIVESHPLSSVQYVDSPI